MANPYRSMVRGGAESAPDDRLFHPAAGSTAEKSTRLIQAVGVTGFFGIPVGAIMAAGGAITGGKDSVWTQRGLRVLGGSTIAFLSVVAINKWVVRVPGY